MPFGQVKNGACVKTLPLNLKWLGLRRSTCASCHSAHPLGICKGTPLQHLTMSAKQYCHGLRFGVEEASAQRGKVTGWWVKEGGPGVPNPQATLPSRMGLKAAAPRR